MRVLHTECSLNWGGQEYRILEQMAWLREHGHATALVAPEGSAIAARARVQGFAVHPMRFRGHYDLAAAWAARRLLGAQAFDVVDCHGSRDGAAFALAAAAPVVRTRHVSQPIKGKAHRRLLWRRGFRRAIATAACIRDGLAAAGLLPASRIDVVGEWAAEAFFEDRPREAAAKALRQEFGIPYTASVVASVGMLRGDKGQNVLIRAVAALVGRGLAVHGVIVGGATASEPDREAGLRALAAALGVADRVVFAGYRDDVAALMRGADVVAVASLAVEGQSRVVPQAFACRTPVVATTVGGLTELVREGETGRLVPPGDAEALALAIAATLDQRAASGAMTATARALAERELRLDAKMAATLEVYRRASERRSHGPNRNAKIGAPNPDKPLV